MRKISNSNLDRTTSDDAGRMDAELTDTGQRRIQGATITSWSERPNFDLTALFARSESRLTPGETLGGAMGGRTISAKPSDAGTISLSDGTKISFATVSKVAIADLV
jgi:hypothetical protein